MPFKSTASLSNITVHPDNKYFYDIDGVLFQYSNRCARETFSGTTYNDLLKFPPARTGSYIVPEGVESIYDGAFCPTRLSEIIFPDSLKYIGLSAISRIPDGTRSVNSITINFPPTMMAIEKNSILNVHFDPVIRGVSGSYAEQYAIENNITFIDVNKQEEDTMPSKTIKCSDWAMQDIIDALESGYVPEEIANDFTAVITRREFCKLAVKFMEHYTSYSLADILSDNDVVVRYPGLFTDTDDYDVLVACALGITNGVGNDKFDPDGQITREQAATMLMRLYKLLLPEQYANIYRNDIFTDIDDASDWAVEGINFCYANDIMNGTGNDKFSPKATYTREQSVVTFERI